MSQYVITPNLVANGNVVPQSFVKLDTTDGLACLQAGSGDTPIGITGNWSRYAGGTPADDGNEAIATEFPEVFGPGSIVPLVCGTTGTWTSGVFLKPDSLGYGTPVTSSADIYGAVALEPATPGVAARVMVVSAGANAFTQVGLLSLSANTTLTTAQSGFLVQVTASDKVITLPVGVPGLRYKIQAATASGAGSTGLTVHAQTGDTLAAQTEGGNGGTAVTPASGKGMINTHGTAISGDFIEVVCTAANTWWAVGMQGIWARET